MHHNKLFHFVSVTLLWVGGCMCVYIYVCYRSICSLDVEGVIIDDHATTFAFVNLI